MRFGRSAEQRGFARSLDDVLQGAGTPDVVRAWAAGNAGHGLRLWSRLADLGVCGLVVREDAGGLGGSFADLAVAFEALGHHAVPGPWVESAAYLPALLGQGPATGETADLLGALGQGAVATVAVRPHTPRALDADVAQHVLTIAADGVRRADPGALSRSVDPARRLFDVTAGAPLMAAPTSSRPYDVAVLACGAQLLGLGERLLDMAVSYATARRQFGRPVGEYQALKHALADVRVHLDFARPLLYGAALSLDSSSGTSPRDVSAAKVAAAEAAYLAARTALQVHGAIGYTAEYDLSLWFGKVRALVSAWGTQAEHRSRVLGELVRSAAR